MEKEVTVLSLFDGMSCGQIALKELGIPVKKYYASEIDKFAIKQTQHNFPNTIQLGDVTKWMNWDVDWKSIDLVLAGSPCQGFSFAGKQLAFDDQRSKLFFVFVDILNHIRKYNKEVSFLFENVRMKKEYIAVINSYLNTEPILINSALVSAQNRKRLYWSNICRKIDPPNDRGVLLRDILETDVPEKYYVSEAVLNRITRRKYSTPKIDPDKTGVLNTKNNSGEMSLDSGTTFISIDGKSPAQRSSTGRSLDKKHNFRFIELDITGGKKNIRRLTPVECSRLQTIPAWYEWVVSDTQIYKMLGNGWTVEVIKHILSYLKS